MRQSQRRSRRSACRRPRPAPCLPGRVLPHTLHVQLDPEPGRLLHDQIAALQLDDALHDVAVGRVFLREVLLNHPVQGAGADLDIRRGGRLDSRCFVDLLLVIRHRALQYVRHPNRLTGESRFQNRIGQLQRFHPCLTVDFRPPPRLDNVREFLIFDCDQLAIYFGKRYLL